MVLDDEANTTNMQNSITKNVSSAFMLQSGAGMRLTEDSINAHPRETVNVPGIHLILFTFKITPLHVVFFAVFKIPHEQQNWVE